MLQNLGWAVGYNVVAIPLAAGVFAWAGVVLAPAVGALAMSLSTIVVAFNAMLLRRLDLRSGPAPDAQVAGERPRELAYAGRLVSDPTQGETEHTWHTSSQSRAST
jgi:hypothetical protein